MFHITTGQITVGYEFTSYTTSEGEGSVEICAIISQPPTGGALRAFVVSASTADGTASKQSLDYMQHMKCELVCMNHVYH